MTGKYDIVFVGDDSLDHPGSVWAKDRDHAIAKARRKYEADMIVHVKRTSAPYYAFAIILIGVAIVALLIMAD